MEMESSEHKIINNSKNLIICFGGMWLRFGSLMPFEFLNYLSKIYSKKADMYFYIDKRRSWYHRGIEGISTGIDNTVQYLNHIIKEGNYKKVTFMGTSAGGYAAILFGSLCRVSNVVSFIPRTCLLKPVDPKYKELKNFINPSTGYILYGDLSVEEKDNNHHISQCNHLQNFNNVKIVRLGSVNMKQLRDNGTIKRTLDNILV